MIGQIKACSTCRHDGDINAGSHCVPCKTEAMRFGGAKYIGWDPVEASTEIAPEPQPMKSCSTCEHNMFAPDDPCKSCVRLFGKSENWIPRKGIGLADSVSTFATLPPVETPPPTPFAVSEERRASMAAVILAGMFGRHLGEHMPPHRRAEFVAMSMQWVDEIETAVRGHRS
ncbi:hypothetical protein [Pleomorphomonas oryzae]|uniref:hypothetical protein n=1 Tax=Pleomorphomonas oryzae TaxID=261934 RepID=UPI00047E882B|nr:hypothetical protein [Pleomorphomonas oryzae]